MSKVTFFSFELVWDLQMEYMRTHTESTDGKVLGVGHSMGGIILYAMLATHGRCI